MSSELNFWEKRWARRQQANTEEVAPPRASGRVHAQATVELPMSLTEVWRDMATDGHPVWDANTQRRIEGRPTGLTVGAETVFVTGPLSPDGLRHVSWQRIIDVEPERWVTLETLAWGVEAIERYTLAPLTDKLTLITIDTWTSHGAHHEPNLVQQFFVQQVHNRCREIHEGYEKLKPVP